MTPDREEKEPRRLRWVPWSDRSAEDDADTHHTVNGRVIRFMWDWTVDIPLWDANGLLPEDPEWLRTELGLSDELIDALLTWGRDMNSVPGAPEEEPTLAAKRMHQQLDSRARQLVEWLQSELGPRYDVDYRPW